MAALMTSVIDNSTKVSEYIMTCRQMGIQVLPPDINEGEGNFSVSGSAIRYGLSAIKSVGRPVIEAITAERELNGPFLSLQDFVERLSGREVNKRAVENFIKSGAFDGLGATRKQFMQVYAAVIDSVQQERKHSLAGQMSLFDLVPEEQKKEYQLKMPDVGEFEKEELLAMEKEVLGVYISGHPMEEYEGKWRKNITNVTSDFMLDEETGSVRVRDGQTVMVGGMIAEKTIKYTKRNQTMAFLTLEDLVGTMEIIVFPRDYEKYRLLLEQDSKIFVRGRVSAEEEKNAKLICERIYSFDDARREVWLQFAELEDYERQAPELEKLFRKSDGHDSVVIYISSRKIMKRLGANMTIRADQTMLDDLKFKLGEKNVKVLEKSIEKL